MAAGTRIAVSKEEIDWACDYERSLLPAHYRFPRKGDIYEAMEEFDTHYMTSWSAPVTGGGSGRVRKGDRFRVIHCHDDRPISVPVEVLNYEEVEQRVVPEDERQEPLYGGVYFHFDTALLNERFRILKENGEA